MLVRHDQTQLTTTLGHIEILEARDPEPQEGPAEAGSSYPEQAFVEYASSCTDEAGESLELGKKGPTFIQGEVPTKIEDPRLRVNIIPLYLFKKLNIRLLEETDHIFGLADETKSYPVGILKDVEVHIENLKLLNDLYVIDMKKDPEAPLLVGRGFLATANVVIVCRMAKIVVGKGITGSVFEVKVVDLGEEEAPYWTTLEKRNHANHDLAQME
nr:hypothetical protein [Tanacetum cinerariifolium]